MSPKVNFPFPLLKCLAIWMSLVVFDATESQLLVPVRTPCQHRPPRTERLIFKPCVRRSVHATLFKSDVLNSWGSPSKAGLNCLYLVDHARRCKLAKFIVLYRTVVRYDSNRSLFQQSGS